MSIDVQHLLSAGGAIARRLDHFESRPQQIEMAAAVDQALENRSHILVEAGTGVGKSFAYLIPAIKRIVEHRERVVVATHTINLQEQLIEKDIPLLNAVIPDEFSAVLVKGRGNYVSLRRLKLASERQDRLFGDPRARESLHELEDWAYTTRDGSLSSLPQLPRPDVWDAAQSESNNCMGRKCPTYDTCFYQAARRRMENGDLLICNHALFFSDLALRSLGVGFLPPYQHLILDEAHGVEEVAAEHFGLSLGESRVQHLLRVLFESRRQRGFLASLRLKEPSPELRDRSIHQVLKCADASEVFFSDLLRWQRKDGRPNGRVIQPDVIANPLTPAAKELADLLRLLKPKAASEADQYELTSYATRAMEIGQHAEILLGQKIEGCVYFIEGADQESSRSRRSRRLTLRCMAVDVAPILREQLFERELSIIMTSATLATSLDRGGDFSHIATRLGCENAETLQLGSPFDFARQMKVYVDTSLPEPNDPRYIDRLTPRVEQLVRKTDGGAFVLFTSFAMLRQVSNALREALTDDGYPVLEQGADGPPGLLLKRFRDDPRSVLFGTSSFWQGVDVQGEGLRNVIITRLPFEVPDRPIVEARHERIRERGGHPFMEDQLPRALIRFRQGVGRLIRAQTDAGVVAVLDPRVTKKSYGRHFLKALPPDVVVLPLDEDEAFA